MRLLVILVTLVRLGESYRTSAAPHHCNLTLQMDGTVIEDGGKVLGSSGDLNQVYCKALCSGSGPSPALKWIKERSPSISYSKRRVYQVRTTSVRINILTIRNMLNSDIGRYTCKGWIRGQGWMETSFEFVHGCSSSYYVCDTNMCISVDLVCNGDVDCRDGSDEQDCGKCAANHFKCDDGECFPDVMKCNGYFECVDGSDELNCGCLPDFSCSYGSCVSLDKVCDGHIDCLVGEDESNCTYCDKEEFHCGKKVCIASAKTCDGQQDCADGSDETNCEIKVSINTTRLEATVGDTVGFTCTAITSSSRGYILSWTKDGTSLPEGATSEASGLVIKDVVTGASGNYVCLGSDGFTNDTAVAELFVNEGCYPEEFICDDGLCINKSRQCNNVTDCKGGEDEKGCSTCKAEEEFPCTSGEQCIAINTRCDGSKNCVDGSDECGCYPEEFICGDGLCINKSRQCNNVTDCKGGEDEMGCSRCYPDEFICDDGLCINKSRQCNNVTDCKGGEDEKGCSKTCTDNMIMCPDGSRCIDITQVCDDKNDCDDNWDEDEQCG